jgi:hypothetical protein
MLSDNKTAGLIRLFIVLTLSGIFLILLSILIQIWFPESGQSLINWLNR